MPDDALRPAFASIADWQKISGMGRSITYQKLSGGLLRAKKCGKSTLIDVEHGLSYMNSLPDAKIGKAGLTVTPLDHAQERGALGFAVFPASLNKIPRTRRGHLDASTDPDTIRSMFVRFGGMLVGIRTGQASDLCILDIDAQHGGGEWWREKRHLLPPTWTYRTRSRGLHVCFRNKVGLRCSTGKDRTWR